MGLVLPDFSVKKFKPNIEKCMASLFLILSVLFISIELHMYSLIFHFQSVVLDLPILLFSSLSIPTDNAAAVTVEDV